MDIDRIIAGVIFVLWGFIAIMARKWSAYNVLMRNIFKPQFDEKRLKIYELMFLAFGLGVIILGIVILLYG